jgi:anti-anti-sigma factor
MNPVELERIGTGLFRLVDASSPKSLVLDFERVKHLSSQAIGIVLTLNKKVVGAGGGRFVLCGAGPSVAQLLKITRLDRVLTITPTQSEALED